MIERLKRLLWDEEGITGLETAIILIAFVVVAAVFAFTILSAGVFSADRSKEAVYAGLSEVRGSIEVRGSVIAQSADNQKVYTITFTIANAAAGQPIDLTVPTDADSNGLADVPTSTNKLVIDYRDQNQYRSNLYWTKSWKGAADGDDLLEVGELAEISIDLTRGNVINPSLGTNTTFQIELKPPRGGVVVIERTTPAYLDTVMTLQ